MALNGNDWDKTSRTLYAILDGLDARALFHPDPEQRRIAEELGEFCRTEGCDILFIEDVLRELMGAREVSMERFATVAEMAAAA